MKTYPWEYANQEEVAAGEDDALWVDIRHAEKALDAERAKVAKLRAAIEAVIETFPERPPSCAIRSAKEALAETGGES